MFGSKNRRRKRNAMIKSGTGASVVVIITALTMVLLYYVLDSRCDMIHRDIGKAERRLAELESECVREAARWDEMKVPEKLSEKLTRFGLEMRYARQDQIVRMNADGRPAPGQISVARASARMRSDGLQLAVSSSHTGRRQPLRQSVEKR